MIFAYVSLLRQHYLEREQCCHSDGNGIYVKFGGNDSEGQFQSFIFFILEPLKNLIRPKMYCDVPNTKPNTPESTVSWNISLSVFACVGNQSSPGQTHLNALTTTNNNSIMIIIILCTGTRHTRVFYCVIFARHLHWCRARSTNARHDTLWHTEYSWVHLPQCVCASSDVIAAAITVILYRILRVAV